MERDPHGSVASVQTHATRPRLENPAQILPEAARGIQSLISAAYKAGLPPRTLDLVHLRVSQINGCAACLESGAKAAKKAGESEVRLATLAGWRHAPHFDDRERAALALAEAMTRMADREDSIPDALWSEVARHYDQKLLAALVLWISLSNLFNRINVSTRQAAGSWE